eukprot:COSAG01_NODE_745_length_13872_cov_40.816525_7_plen_3569_part_00
MEDPTSHAGDPAAGEDNRAAAAAAAAARGDRVEHLREPSLTAAAAEGTGGTPRRPARTGSDIFRAAELLAALPGIQRQLGARSAEKALPKLAKMVRSRQVDLEALVHRSATRDLTFQGDAFQSDRREAVAELLNSSSKLDKLVVRVSDLAEIPAGLGQADSMRELCLTFVGRVAPPLEQIGRLSSLRVLRLEWLTKTAEAGIDNVPSALVLGMHELEELELTSLYAFHGEFLPDETACTKLRRLKLHLWPKKATRSIPQFLTVVERFTSLEELDLSNGNLRLLPTSLRLPALRILNLSGNRLLLGTITPGYTKWADRYGSYVMDDGTVHLKRWEWLTKGMIEKLRHQVHQDQADKNVRTVFGLGSLEELDVSGTDLRSIPPEVSRLSKLRILKLSSEEGLELDPAVFDLDHLTHLYVGRCSMNLDHLRNTVLCHRAASKLKSLLALELQEPSGKEAIHKRSTALSQILDAMPSLTELDLSLVTGLPAVLETIGRLGNLRSLRLNNVIDEGCTDFAPLARLSKLENLTIETGPEAPCFCLPAEIGLLENLHSLTVDLSGCPDLLFAHCENLPTILGKLHALQKLRLDQIALQSLPEQMGELSNLCALDLDIVRCDDWSSLGSILQRLTSLEELTISTTYDQPLFALPDEIGALSELVRLDICAPSLCTVPWQLILLPKLQSLSLRSCYEPSKLELELLDQEPEPKPERMLLTTQSLGLLETLNDFWEKMAWLYTHAPEHELAEHDVPNRSTYDDGLLAKLILKFPCVPRRRHITDSTVVKLPPGLQRLAGLKVFDMAPTYNGRDLGYEVRSPFKSLCSLPCLEKLRLSGFRLSAVPAEIGQLSSLKELDISLDGSGPAVLPAEIGLLTQLRHLTLVGWDKLLTLPGELGHLSNLEELDLSRCRALNALPVELGKLRSLRRLELGGCEALGTLPWQLILLPALHSIELRGTAVTRDAFFKDVLPFAELETQSELLAVWLWLYMLVPKSDLDQAAHTSIAQIEDMHLTCGALPEPIGRFTHLRWLKVSVISYCQKDALCSVPDSLCTLTSLEELDLRETRITELPQTLGNLQNLRRLMIPWQLTALPSSTAELLALEELSSNYSWRGDMSTLPWQLALLPNLRTIALPCGNKLLYLACLAHNYKEGGKSAFLRGGLREENLASNPSALLAWLYLHVPEEMVEVGAQAAQIEELNLADLALGDNFRPGVPETIGRLARLRSLNLSGNSDLRELPSALFGLRELTYLNLSGTRLSALSEDIGRLSALQQLSLGACMNLCTLPDALFGLSALKELDLSKTSLTELADDISRLSALELLDLSEIVRLESLPCGVYELASLTALDIGGTRVGELSERLGNLTMLTHLNLQGTQIAELPATVGKLHKLRRLMIPLCLTHVPTSTSQLLSLEELSSPASYSPGEGMNELPWQLALLPNLKTVALWPCERRLPILARLAKKVAPRLEGEARIENSLDDQQVVDVSTLLAWLYLHVPEQMVEPGAQAAQIEKLNLADLALTDLPQTIGRLTRLRSLNLSRNSDLRELPSALFGLRELAYLNLSGTRLSALSADIGRLSALQQLSLGACRDLCALPDALFGLSALKELDLSKTSLTELADDISRLSALELLDLSEIVGLRSLPCGVYELASLTHLNLQGTQIAELPATVGKLHNLRRLDLSECFFLNDLPCQLALLPELYDINLRLTPLRGQTDDGVTVLYVPQPFKRQDNVQVYVSICDDMSGRWLLHILHAQHGPFAVLQWLRARDPMHHQLIELSRRESEYEAESGKESRTEVPPHNVDPYFGTNWAQSTQENLVCRPGRYMPKIERLDFCAAFPFSDVPEEISQLTSLKALRFRGSTELRSLTALSNLPDLTALDLCHSEFSEPPHDIGNVRTLQQLNLCGVERLASLPDSLFDLPCLVRLALVNNPQLRNMPPSIDRLNTLEELLLTGCLLLSKLPLELQNLTGLRRLDLSGCPLLTQEHRIYEDACSQATMVHKEEYSTLPGVRAVIAYLRDYYADEPTRQYLLKLVLIGPTMAGKTSLIYGLKHGKARLADKDTERTIVLHVDRWKVTDTEMRSQGHLIEVVVYDCGGHSEYQDMLQPFFSDGALYLLAWDLSKPEPPVSQLRHWISCVQSCAPGSIVVLVGSHLDEVSEVDARRSCDTVKRGLENERDNWKRHQDGQFSPHSARLTNRPNTPLVQLTEPIMVSAADLTNFDVLRKRILDAAFDATAFPEFGDLQPRCYAVMRQQLRSLSTITPTTTWTDVREVLKQSADKSDVPVNRLEVVRLEESVNRDRCVIVNVEIQMDGIVLQALEFGPEEVIRWHNSLGKTELKDSLPAIPRHLNSANQLVSYLEQLLPMSAHPDFGAATGFDASLFQAQYRDVLERMQKDIPLLRRSMRFLRLTGNVLYYDHVAGLKDRIFLRPEWLVDVLKELVRHDLEQRVSSIPTFTNAQAASQLQQLAENFLSTGVLHCDLLDWLWNHLPGFNTALRAELTQLLQELSVMVPWSPHKDKPQWLVPLRLPFMPDTCPRFNAWKFNQSVICRLYDFGSTIPSGLFAALVNRCVSKNPNRPVHCYRHNLVIPRSLDEVEVVDTVDIPEVAVFITHESTKLMFEIRCAKKEVHQVLMPILAEYEKEMKGLVSNRWQGCTLECLVLVPNPHSTRDWDRFLSPYPTLEHCEQRVCRTETTIKLGRYPGIDIPLSHCVLMDTAKITTKMSASLHKQCQTLQFFTKVANYLDESMRTEELTNDTNVKCHKFVRLLEKERQANGLSTISVQEEVKRSGLYHHSQPFGDTLIPVTFVSRRERLAQAHELLERISTIYCNRRRELDSGKFTSLEDMCDRLLHQCGWLEKAICTAAAQSGLALIPSFASILQEYQSEPEAESANNVSKHPVVSSRVDLQDCVESISKLPVVDSNSKLGSSAAEAKTSPQLVNTELATDVAANGEGCGTVLYNEKMTQAHSLPILSFSTERKAIVGLSLDATISVRAITASLQEEFKSVTSNLDERLVMCMVSPLIETRPHDLEFLEEPATLTFDLLDEISLRPTDLVVLHKAGPHTEWELLNEEVKVDGRRATIRVCSFCWRVVLSVPLVAGLVSAAAAASVEMTSAVTSMAAAGSTFSPAIVSAGTVGLLIAAGMVKLPPWLDRGDPERWKSEGTDWGGPPQKQKITDLIRQESLRDATPLYHFFLCYQQVGGGSQVGELYALLTHRLGLKCCRDLSQALQDVDAKIRGVAQSSVYVLYLTRGDGSHDALSYYVTVEARAAMMLEKPVVVLMENDKRKPSYAGGSIERAIAGWPVDLQEYFHNGRFVAWGGQPYEWSEVDMDAKLKTVLDRCKTINPPIPSGTTSWADAVTKLLAPVDALEKLEPELGPEPEPEPEPKPESEPESLTLLHFHSNSEKASDCIARSLTQEKANIDKCWKESPFLQVNFQSEIVSTWDEIWKLLPPCLNDSESTSGRKHARILHFGGHGCDEDVNSRARVQFSEMPSQDFAEIICRYNPECVVLNACNSHTMAISIAKINPAITIICWSSNVQTEVCEELASYYYGALGAWRPKWRFPNWSWYGPVVTSLQRSSLL